MGQTRGRRRRDRNKVSAKRLTDMANEKTVAPAEASLARSAGRLEQSVAQQTGSADCRTGLAALVGIWLP